MPVFENVKKGLLAAVLQQHVDIFGVVEKLSGKKFISFLLPSSGRPWKSVPPEKKQQMNCLSQA
jgi:hypothetical protein